MAISGLFYSGALNGQNVSLIQGKIIQPSKANNIQPSSEANANYKVKDDKLVVNARCSCSLYGDYRVHDPSWVNYCPVCHRHGTLIFEKTSDCPEGMIRCTCCDADFCAVHGKEHVNYHPTYLTPA